LKYILRIKQRNRQKKSKQKKECFTIQFDTTLSGYTRVILAPIA
jgi:hypothetical protein